MNKAEVKALVNKATERLERLRNMTSEGLHPVSIEAQNSLEKSLESYLNAAAYLQGAKKEHEIARGHRDVAAEQLRFAHKAVKKLMKRRPGRKGRKT